MKRWYIETEKGQSIEEEEGREKKTTLDFEYYTKYVFKDWWLFIIQQLQQVPQIRTDEKWGA